ncbi:hypothetical protein [Nonomuraea sp. B1E8]|uniref:hypothetical protein n=1 Tax=unclassified Nonomuraea TaxID=2593643 RepID=UPI00325C3948
MEGDHRVWPPQTGARHRRTPPEDRTAPEDGTSPESGASPEGSVSPEDGKPVWGAHREGRPRRGKNPFASVRDTAAEAKRPPAPADPAQERNRRSVSHPAQGAGWGPVSGAGRETGWGSASEPGWGASPEVPYETGWGDFPGRDDGPSRGRRERSHPLDLGPDPEDEQEPWNPRIRGATYPGRHNGQDTGLGGGRGRGSGTSPTGESLPPSARLYGSPADPGARGRVGGRRWRRWAGVLVALPAGAGLIVVVAVVVLTFAAPPAETGRLSDSRAGVSAALPQGWREGPVPPVTGFTSVVRDDAGALVMARPMPPVKDAGKAVKEAAELYSRLLLKGDRVTVVEDKQVPGGHTRALRAEYRDVVNRPAFLRVMLLTRGARAVLLVGLLQPADTGRRQELDTVMTSLRPG